VNIGVRFAVGCDVMSGCGGEIFSRVRVENELTGCSNGMKDIQLKPGLGWN